MIQYQTQAGKSRRDAVTGIYLGILSRFPTEAEVAAATAYGGSGSVKPRDAAIDLAWALINSTEFLYRH